MNNTNPADFVYPISLLREVMNLSNNAVIIKNGYENIYSIDHRRKIRERYDFNSLIISGRPDFQVFDNDKFFLVEGKTSPRIVEAVPLLLNLLYSKYTEIPVYYSFLDSYKRAEEIPFNWIKIPKNHSDEFNANFKDLFLEYGVLEENFEYVEYYENDSGDPFILDTRFPRLSTKDIQEFLRKYSTGDEI